MKKQPQQPEQQRSDDAIALLREWRATAADCMDEEFEPWLEQFTKRVDAVLDSAPTSSGAPTEIEALVAEIDALERKATPGPWAWDQRGEKTNEWGLGVAMRADDTEISGLFKDEDAIYVEYVCSHEAATCNYDDPEFICAFRNAWPLLREALQTAQKPNPPNDAVAVREALAELVRLEDRSCAVYGRHTQAVGSERAWKRARALLEETK